ncbi:MAG: fibronectin type III domain-containing protein, partial [Kiritimatiellia bacterium]
MKSSFHWFRSSVVHSAVALAVGALATTTARSESVQIYQETFAGSTTTTIKSNTKFVSSDTEEVAIYSQYTDHDDWTGIFLRAGYHSFRLGNDNSLNAMAKSGAIALTNGAETATITVSFYACNAAQEAKELKFSILDSAGGEVSTQTITSLNTVSDGTAIPSDDNLQTVMVENVPTGFHLKFQPGQANARIFVGGITVMQELSADPVEPVDTPVFTGPKSVELTAGTETTFEVKAALSDSTAVDVVFDGIEPSATTTPAFADGVFAWTPAEADVGEYTANFHATANNTDYPYSVSLTVSLPPAPTTTKTLLSETFSGSALTTKWSSTSYKSILAEDGTTFLPNVADLVGWTGSNLLSGIKGILLGKASNYHGAALSPLIEKTSHVAATPIQVSFNAAKVTNIVSNLKIAIVAEDGTVVTSATKSPVVLSTASDAEITNTVYALSCEFTDVPSRFRVLFEPTGANSRICLDSIVVSRELADGVPQLAAPSNLAASELTKTGFAVAWDAVESASGYELYVKDAAGAIVASVLADTNSATVDGLENGTAYSVSVVAIGDDVACYDSEWSDAIEVTTVEDVNEPEWAVTGSTDFTALTAGSFAVASSLDETSLSVSLESIEPALTGAAPVWDGSILSWTPSLDDVGSFTITFATLVGETTYRHQVAVTVADLPPLSAVKPELSEIESNGFRLDWIDDQIRTEKYGLRIWYGTDDPTNATADVERFLEYSGNTLLIPLGWSSQGTGNYDYDSDNRVQFDSTGDTMTTKRYPEPVTEFSYTILRKGSGSGDTNAIFRVEATADDSTWTEVAVYQGWNALVKATHTL